MKVKKIRNLVEQKGFDIYARTPDLYTMMAVDANNIVLRVNVRTENCSLSYKIPNSMAEIRIEDFGPISNEKLWNRMYHQMKDIVYRFQA